MNKSALKNFATSARRELLQRVELQARKVGITSESIQKAQFESSDAIFIGGKQLSEKERVQRNKLITRIGDIGFDRVMEETAYIWFNRFTALRFMEVNDYLPTKVRVLSSINPESAEPDMMKEALSLDLDLDKEHIYELKITNNNEELFKYLIIKHCNDLNRYMPFMFETIDDYTEILFPGGLLSTDSFIRRMTDTENIQEVDWNKVEIIGWLYQYYISEENERVIQAKKRYKAEELPFATQLFTPEWIVRYMVQNSLGRYWIESNPEHQELIKNWEFYLVNQNGESDFEANVAPYSNKQMRVEDIKCFDPAMGSGHILVYMFDVLHEIYSKSGYMDREIPRLIIENNLYGLDIDDRSYQLASFSVVMKALEYNKRFLRSIERDGLTMKLAALQETNTLNDDEVAFLAGESSGKNYEDMKDFVKQFSHAKSIGSLIKLNSFNEVWLDQRMEVIEEQSDNLFEMEMKDRLAPLFNNLIKQASIMNQQNDIFITNPPYAGNKYVTPEVAKYLSENYSEAKSDLFAAFIEYSFTATKNNGQIGFITPFVWMFISSFKEIRRKIVEEKNISSLIQLEYNGFEAAVVPVCLFTLRNYQLNTAGAYIRLSDFKGVEKQPLKVIEAIQNPDVNFRYAYNQNAYKNIPDSPIAYWITPKGTTAFKRGKLLKDLAKPKAGLATGNNNIFQKFWYEVDYWNIGFNYSDVTQTNNGVHRWFPCNSGGEFRKWSTKDEYVVDWQNDGERIKQYRNESGKLAARPQNTRFYFKKGFTWNKLSNATFSVKFKPEGFVFDDTSRSAFVDDEKDLIYLIGLLCSKVTFEYLKMLNPTMSFTNGDLERIPYLYSEKHADRVERLVEENIRISKTDWDSNEISWRFDTHPIIKNCSDNKEIEVAFWNWKKLIESQFYKLKTNEEELNSIFLEIYDLTDELTSTVQAKDVTIRPTITNKDIKSFISYAMGCFFGRYSIEKEGLIQTGSDFSLEDFDETFISKDNIIPVTSDTYFKDDVITKFIIFLQATFGKEVLNKNLSFVADMLGQRNNETPKETLRRYLLNEFYKDHVHIYKGRPIYWLFTSGKEKAFNCLIYMHRYDKTTLSRIRTDYLHEVQIRLDAENKGLLNIIEGDSSAKEISNAKKELKSLDKKIHELKVYDEKLHHKADMQIEIDLNDGVALNYAKFEGLVAKF